MTTTAATQPDLADVHPATAAKRPFWKNLGFQVVVSMVLGIIVGLVWPDFATSLKILGDIFLRLIKTAVAPLVFLTVAVGIVAAGDVKRVGKVGLIAMIYFEILSTIALALGLVFGNLVGVGKNMGHVAAPEAATKAAEAAAKAAASSHTTFDQFLLNVFPDNFIGAFARGELLQVLVIAIIFGFGLMALKPEKRIPIENGLNSFTSS
jgi:aerobic C4-dicarboxylate transport protein